METNEFDLRCSELRYGLRTIAASVLELKVHPEFQTKPEDYRGQQGEMMANVMLAYRHLEDAAMRLGKAIQARDGGTSVYTR